MSTPRLLVVDDDPAVRDGIRRQMTPDFDIDDAGTGEVGLSVLRRRGPFAVVVADYRLPKMSGVTFLTRVREEAPESVRVILTGAGDMEAAVEAVNEGHVFRSLVKPSPAARLRRVLLDSLAQHRLLTAERDVLERTLAGAVQVLTEVLGLVSPEAFGRAARLKACVAHLARQLHLPGAWQLEVAAMLSQIGYIALPAETLSKLMGGGALSPEERDQAAAAPGTARALLGRIPRFEEVAQIVALASPPADLGEVPDAAGFATAPATTQGAWLLRVALALDERMVRGLDERAALADLRRPGRHLPGPVLDALERFVVEDLASRVEVVDLRGLHTLMVLEEDVRTPSGLLLVPRGQPVTVAVIQRLRGFARGPGVREPFRVRVPDPALRASAPEPLES